MSKAWGAQEIVSERQRHTRERKALTNSDHEKLKLTTRVIWTAGSMTSTTPCADPTPTTPSTAYGTLTSRQDPKYRSAWKWLREWLVGNEVMAHPNLDPNGPGFVLFTDASLIAASAVLMQEQDGKPVIISYSSAPVVVVVVVVVKMVVVVVIVVVVVVEEMVVD